MLPMVIKLTCLSAVLHRPLAGPSGLGKSLWSRKPAGRPGLAGPGLPCLGNRGGSCRSPRRRRRPTKGWALKPDQPGCGARSAVAPVDSRGRCFRCFRRSSQSKTTSPSKTATRLVGRGPVDRRGRGCRSRRERCQLCGEEGRPVGALGCRGVKDLTEGKGVIRAERAARDLSDDGLGLVLRVSHRHSLPTRTSCLPAASR